MCSKGPFNRDKSSISDPMKSVALLPDEMNYHSRHSSIVVHQNNLLHEKYSAQIEEYNTKLKCINSEINIKIGDICLSYCTKLKNKYYSIEDHLLSLRACTSPTNFHDVWGLISSSATFLLETIASLRLKLISIENDRMQQLLTLIQDSYLAVKENCNCDDQQLDIFYNREIYDMNKTSLSNHKKYTLVIAALKMEVTQYLQAWHCSWEELLYAWRDQLTEQNIDQIHSLTHHKEYLYPFEIMNAHKKSKALLKEMEISINENLNHLCDIMPITIEIAIQAFDKIDQSICNCEEVIAEYDRHSTEIYSTKLKSILLHANEMERYLKNNFVFEENKSYNAFEYSVYVICSAFESKINEKHLSLLNELNQIIGNTKKLSQTVKDYVFTLCTTWCEYMNDFEVQSKHFIRKIDRSLQEYNCRISWLEKKLDKLCNSMFECQTHKHLDRKLSAAETVLANIFDEHSKFESSLQEQLVQSMSEWGEVEKKYEALFIEALGLKEADKSGIDFNVTIVGKSHTIQESVFNGLMSLSTCVSQFVMKCCENCCENFVSQKEENQHKLTRLLDKRTKEAESEVMLRKEFHKPRLSFITSNCYDVRKVEIEKLNYDSELLLDTISHLDMKYVASFDRLVSSIEVIIESHDKIMSEIESEILIKENSSDLMALKDKFKVVHSESINEFQSAFEPFRVEANLFRDGIESKYQELLKRSESAKLKFIHEQKIKNEMDEFDDLAAEMRLKAEELEIKSDHIDVRSLKALSCYKHALVCLFYLERREMILKNCRMNIKHHSVACCKGMFQFNTKMDKFLSGKEYLSPSSVEGIMDEFETLYLETQKLTTLFNFDCDVDELSQCLSMEKLQKRYSKFGNAYWNNYSSDSAFIKEIYKVSKDEACDLKQAVHYDDLNWKINRSKILYQYGWTSRVRYGVGVKAERISSPIRIMNRKKKAPFSNTSPRNSLSFTQSQVNAQPLKKPATLEEKPYNSNDEDVQDKAIYARTCMASLDDTSMMSQFIDDSPLVRKTGSALNSSSSLSSSGAIVPPGSKYFYMKDSLKLINASDLFRRSGSNASRKSSEYSSTYDFNKTSDDDIKAMLFQSNDFFKLKKRNIDVKAVTDQITSLLEKVKFHLRLALEDYVIMSEIFFKQNNIWITKKEIIKDIDIATKDMENVLQNYFDKALVFSCDGVNKLKDLLVNLNSYQFEFISEVFKIGIQSFNDDLQNIFTKISINFDDFESETQNKLNQLIEKLTPSLSHPKNTEQLESLQSEACLEAKGCLQEFEALFTEASATLNIIYKKSMDNIEFYKKSLYNIADSTIYPEFIRRVSQSRNRGISHQDCLREKSGESARKMHECFTKAYEKVCEKPHVKLYDHIAHESAYAIVHIENAFKSETDKIDMKRKSSISFVNRWICYWNDYIDKIRSDIVY